MVSKLSTSLSVGVKAGCVRLCLVTGNTVWSQTASDTPQLWDGFPFWIRNWSRITIYLVLFFFSLFRGNALQKSLMVLSFQAGSGWTFGRIALQANTHRWTSCICSGVRLLAPWVHVTSLARCMHHSSWSIVHLYSLFNWVLFWIYSMSGWCQKANFWELLWQCILQAGWLPSCHPNQQQQSIQITDRLNK